MADILLDASYLVALGYPADQHHAKARALAAEKGPSFLIPDVVLAEAFYNLRGLTNTHAATRFAESLSRRPPRLLGLTPIDFSRGVQVMRQYEDAELDFVDACLTAMAERLNITQIATFDRRDFSMIRPRHISYFELLP